MTVVTDRPFAVTGLGVHFQGVYDLPTRVVVQSDPDFPLEGWDLWRLQKLCDQRGWSLKTSGGFQPPQKRKGERRPRQ